MVDTCGYQLPTNLQKFRQKRLNQSENIPESFREITFLKHPVGGAKAGHMQSSHDSSTQCSWLAILGRGRGTQAVPGGQAPIGKPQIFDI